MNDEYIIKGLERCTSTSCDGCPYDGDDLLRPCHQNMMRDAINLINRLKEEKRARWLINCDGWYLYCSNCKQEPQGRVATDYCPNCGYKMK